MTSGKIKAVLFIIVFLLIVAVVASWFVSRDEQQEPPANIDPIETVDEGVVVVVTPAPTAVLLTPAPTPYVAPKATPAPTPVPTPVPTPTPTPEPLFELPTAAPQPAEVIVGQNLGSGSCRSQTGLGIDLFCEWTVTVASAEEVNVTLNVGVSSYALHSQSLPDGVLMSVGGQYATMASPAVDYDGTTLASHSFGSHTFTVSAPAGTTTRIPVQVNWQFNGSFGGTALPSLECGDAITVTR